MSWKMKVGVGALLIVIGLVVMLAGFNTKDSLRSHLQNSETFTYVSNDQYQCTDAKSAYDELRTQTRPEASKEDRGSYYLRYSREMVTISQSSGSCTLRIEDLRRLNNGHFIFLGTGFSPGSPSNSSGGTGGSFFGSK